MTDAWVWQVSGTARQGPQRNARRLRCRGKRTNVITQVYCVAIRRPICAAVCGAQPDNNEWSLSHVKGFPRQRFLRGLGREIVTAALAAGHRVMATARDPRSLEDLVAAHGNQVRASQLDVTDPEAAERVVLETVEAFGRLDVVVNNAGQADRASLEDSTLERSAARSTPTSTAPSISAEPPCRSFAGKAAGTSFRSHPSADGSPVRG